MTTLDIEGLHARVYAKRLAAGLVVRTTREDGRTYDQAFASMLRRDDYMRRAELAGFTVEIL